MVYIHISIRHSTFAKQHVLCATPTNKFYLPRSKQIISQDLFMQERCWVIGAQDVLRFLCIGALIASS